MFNPTNLPKPEEPPKPKVFVDCIGNELKVGDAIAAADARYTDLLIGRVIGFSPKKIRIRYRHTNEIRYTDTTTKSSYQLIKIPYNIRI